MTSAAAIHQRAAEDKAVASAPEPQNTGNGMSRAQLVVLLLLIMIAAVLRLHRLDLMSFRYDSAEALFRARETLQLGYPPLTGIENSLGFRNPAGFIWAILPAALLSPAPELSAAWIGLLTLTGIWPMFQIGRMFLSGWLWLLPCALYAVLPMSVAAGRNVWAQNLMFPLGAWSLWFLLAAVSRSDAVPLMPAQRGRRAVASIAIAAFATAVHLAGIAYLFVCLILLIPAFRSANPLPRRYLFWLLATGLLTAAMLGPSAIDYATRRANPQPKSDFAAHYDSYMPPPPPIGGRIAAAVRGPFQLPSTPPAMGGIDSLLTTRTALLARIADFAVLFLVSIGLVRAALLLVRRIPNNQIASHRTFSAPAIRLSAALLAWTFVPVILAIIFIQNPNPTYFSFALAPLLILAGIGAETILRLGSSHSGKIAAIAPPALAAMFAMCYIAYWTSAIRALDQTPVANGDYYIPLHLQKRLAQRAARAGVPAGNLHHLSGGWFQRSYDYLHQEVARAPRPSSPRGAAFLPWMLLDDEYLRTNHPQRLNWLREKFPGRIGTARYRVVENEYQVSRFAGEFIRIPKSELPR